MSKIIEDSKQNNNVLALDCGDLFKGIYPRELEVESYIEVKKMPSVLRLTKSYSNPCSLGTFLADNMKELTNSDVGFFSTGFLMAPLPYIPGKMINSYDLKKDDDCSVSD